MSKPRHINQEQDVEDLRARQDRFWSRDVCEIALAVRRMWKAMAADLQISEDAIHAITNLAKSTSDHTLSISELAQHSDLTIEQATAAIDTLVHRKLAVRALPRAGEAVQDRRVQLPDDLVGMIFGYYRLQPQHRGLLDQFNAEQIEFVSRFLAAFAEIANDQASAIHTNRIDPAAAFKASLDGTG